MPHNGLYMEIDRTLAGLSIDRSMFISECRFNYCAKLIENKPTRNSYSADIFMKILNSANERQVAKTYSCLADWSE